MQELQNPIRVGDDHDVAREKSVLVRLTVDQHARWTAAATADKRTLADWVRVVIDEQLEKAPPAIKPTKRKR